MNAPLKICFVSCNAYPVINPRASGSFGGMETGAWEFARSLAAEPGVNVSLVVQHRQAPRNSSSCGVKIVNGTSWIDACREDVVHLRQGVTQGHWPGPARCLRVGLQAGALLATRPFRVRHDQEWKQPWRALTRLHADVYAPTGVNLAAARTIRTAHALGRPAALLLMSDADLNPKFLSGGNYQDEYGNSAETGQFVLTHADGIFAQTPRQQAALRTTWNRDSFLVTNALDVAAWDAAARLPLPVGLSLPETPFVLWIGRADRFHKRPLELVRVARELPNIPFVMVLDAGEAEIQAEVRACTCPNLIVIDPIPFGMMSALMAKAALLVSTGSAEFEGLPNVLLQAAASRLPIVSLEAGEEWLRAAEAGSCAQGNRGAFAKAIHDCWSQRNSPEVRQFGDSGRHYVEREHAGAVIRRRFTDGLQTMIEQYRHRQ